MLLGGGSVVLALVEPQRQGVPTGFVVSTIGVTAIACGVQAVRRARWSSVVARAFGRVGGGLGAVGSALMLYALLGYGLATIGVHVPALSLPSPTNGMADTVAVPAAPAPVVAPQSAATPAPAAVTAEQERSSLTQAIGSLAFSMRERFPSGGFPEQLVTSTSPSSIALPDGSGLASLPEDTRVLYSVSADRSAWSITLVGAAHRSVATYSSVDGALSVG